LTEIVLARPSSTVVLVREASAAPEILMVRRHAQLSFGESYAFPGGVLEGSDHRVHDRCSGISAVDADRLLDVDGNGLDYLSAAIRELFEETGVMLAPTGLSDDEKHVARKQLNDGLLPWDELLKSKDIRLACDSLHYFGYWMTPVCQPKRYSTRFFVAELPDGQRAVHDGAELTDSFWMTAGEVLETHRDQRMSLPFPTTKTLESIAAHDSVAKILEWAKTCVAVGVSCKLPKVIEENGKKRIVLPEQDVHKGTG